MPLPSKHNKKHGHLDVTNNLRKALLAAGVPVSVANNFREMDRAHHPLANALMHGGNPEDDRDWRQTIDLSDPKPIEEPNWQAAAEYASQAIANAIPVYTYFQNPVTEQALRAADAMAEAIKVKDWLAAWYHKTAYMDAIVIFSWQNWDARTAGSKTAKWGRFEEDDKWRVTIYPETYLKKLNKEYTLQDIGDMLKQILHLLSTKLP